MNKFELASVLKIVNRREQLLKAMAVERAAKMLEEFEAQCAAIYEFDDDSVWEKAMESVQTVVNKANSEITKRCKDIGIPKGFEPCIEIDWSKRGQNQVAERRNELRRVAKAKIDAIRKEACAKIELLCLKTETEIISSGICSPESKKILNGMPDIVSLMPTINAKEVKQLCESTSTQRDNW